MMSNLSNTVKRKKPIGCRVIHFPRMIGNSMVCMHCGEVVDHKNFTKSFNENTRGKKKDN